MMCLVNSSGGEFNTQKKVGSHQITASVEIPQKEVESVFTFFDRKSTQLDDILFILTLFTDRNVIKKDWEDNENTVILTDHRIHQYGGQLRCSIKYESMWKNKDTGELKTYAEMKGTSVFNYNPINVGFEKVINKVLTLISSK